MGHNKDIKPIATLPVSGLVGDFVEDDGLLYVGTDAGVVDIIDLFTQKTVSQIHFKPMKTMMGNEVPVRVHSNRQTPRKDATCHLWCLWLP